MTHLTKFDPFLRNISKYDPFNITENMSDMLKSLWQPTWLADAAQIGMKVDISENESSYMVRADIPGVKKDDIKVEIDGNRVSICAETKSEKEEKKGETIIRSERYYGRASRQFTLDRPVDEASVTAKYADGVLELTLPKKNGSASKQISIQ